MSSGYGWFGIYLSVGTVALCAYLVWRAIRDARSLDATRKLRKTREAEPEPWKRGRGRAGGWSPDVRPWRPAQDDGWSPDEDDAAGGVVPRD